MFATLASLLVLGLPAPKTPTSLVSDVSVVQPGKPFTVALKMEMAPGWHSYYLNPGEAGQATSIKWKLPAGFTAGPIQWPAPSREDFEGIASFVYEGELWLLTTVAPSAGVKPGPIKLSGHVDWLLCSTACVPQSSDLSLNLSVGPKAVQNQQVAGLFAKARAKIPTPAGFDVRARSSAKTVVLQFMPPSADPSGSSFIPADADAFGANQGEWSTVDGKAQVTVPLSIYAKKAPSRIKGILVIANGTDRNSYAIDVPVEKS